MSPQVWKNKFEKDVIITRKILFQKSLLRRSLMNSQRKILNLVFVMILFVTLHIAGIVFAGGQKTIKKYPIPEHGTLELRVPTSWKGEVHKSQENMPPTIIFNPQKGNDFQVVITVQWSKSGEQAMTSSDKVRARVENDGKKLLSNTVETKIVLREIKGPSNTGYYFSVTDKAPNPGEFRYMTRGSMGVGNLLVNATILHRVKESDSVKDTLSMLREARQIAK